MTFDRQVSPPILDVAFVIYNCTSKMLLKKMLDFFSKSELSFSYSLTVVDDASEDGSRELVLAYQGVYSVFLESCHGVGRAVNRGLAVTPESRYLCLLHTDVNLNGEALESLVQHCDAHQEVKVCAPTICFPWGQPQKFVFSPSLLARYFGAIDKFLSKSVAKRLRSSVQPVRVAGIIGPFLFCSRELVVDNRLYDEGFRHHFCDMDLAHRLMRMGVVCEVIPHRSLVRLGGQTSFIRDPETYYAMKYAYVKRFYGQRHARLCLKSDIVRAWFKVFSYTVFNRIAPSSKLSFQIQRYGNLRDTLAKVQKHTACFPGDTE